MGPVTFQLSEQDFLSFQRLLYRSNLPRAIIVMALTLSALFVFEYWWTGTLHIAAALKTSAVVGMLISALWAFSYFFYLARHSAKIWSEYKLLGEAMTMTADSIGFTINQPSAHVTSEWTSMVKWNEDNRVFAIHVAGQMAYIIPKNAATVETVDYARQCLIASGLPQKGKLRK